MDYKTKREVDAVLDLFGSLAKPVCTECANKKYAFGVRICGLAKPEPKDGEKCDFWRKKQ